MQVKLPLIFVQVACAWQGLGTVHSLMSERERKSNMGNKSMKHTERRLAARVDPLVSASNYYTASRYIMFTGIHMCIHSQTHAHVFTRVCLRPDCTHSASPVQVIPSPP